MSELISDLFSGLTTTITSMAGGLKDAFMNFLYVDPAATTKVIADPVKFILIFGGVSIGMGLLWRMVGLIRRH